MAIVPGRVRTPAVRPLPTGPGRARKVGLLGSAAASLAAAPWMDPTWEFWAHASVYHVIPADRADRLFDQHPPNCFQETRKNGFKDYYGWLKTQGTPIYMQARYPEIPASVKYPRELVESYWPGVPMGSQTAWMIALALIEGVTHLGCWGIHYAHGSEYAEQRANCEHWIGIARGMGVHVLIPSVSPLCHEPRELYGYESHSPEKYSERKRRFKLAMQASFSPDHLQPLETPADLDRAAAIRAEKSQVWAAEVKKFQHEVIPPAILAQEARERAELTQA